MTAEYGGLPWLGLRAAQPPAPPLSGPRRPRVRWAPVAPRGGRATAGRPGGGGFGGGGPRRFRADARCRRGRTTRPGPWPRWSPPGGPAVYPRVRGWMPPPEPVPAGTD